MPRGHAWHACPPEQNDTLVKILPCPKLRLRAVIKVVIYNRFYGSVKPFGTIQMLMLVLKIKWMKSV